MKRQYLVTERAHFMCPNMHFGILLEVEKEFQKQLVEETLNRMAAAHPFLKSLIAYEDGTNRLYYNITPNSQIDINIMNDENTIWEDYENIAREDWNVFENGLLKVFIYPKLSGMKILFVMHHLLVDGKGALSIAEEFANDYVGSIKPVYVEEQLIQNINDLPYNSKLSGISKLLVRQANRKWEKENQTLSYEKYRDFVKEYNSNHKTEHQTYELNHSEVEQILKICHENNITMNDYLMAQMYQEAKTDKIIIAADIRKKFSGYQQGALGNYATAMGIVCKSKTSDIIELAKEIHNLVIKHMNNSKSLMLVLTCYFEMNPTLLDAAAISALGGFSNKAGNFVGKAMFHMDSPCAYSITNLGRINNDNMKSVLFIPPASPATKLTLGVVTLNGEMKACSSINY